MLAPRPPLTFFRPRWWVSRTVKPVILAALLVTGVLPSTVAQTADTRSQIAAAFQAGDAETLEALLVEAGASDLERVYFAGLLMQKQGRHREAADLFRKILIYVPHLRPMREAVIQSLVALEEYDGALFHLDELIETEPAPDRRRQYQNARVQILARRPYGFSFGLSLVPSSNINRASGTETIELGGLPFQLDDTPQSGVGLTLSLGAFRQMSLGEGQILRFNLDSSATAYDDPAFNRASFGVGLSYTRLFESGSWTYAGGLTRNVHDDQVNNHMRYYVSGRREWLQSPRQIWGFTLGASQTDFDATANDGFDAYRLDASIDLRRRFGDMTTIGATFNLGFEAPEDPRYEFTSYKFGVSVDRAWQTGWQLGLGADYEAKPYANTFGGIFPYAREDESVGLRVSVANRNLQIRNTVPSLTCSATHTTSNIAIFDDRDVLECNLLLSRRF